MASFLQEYDSQVRPILDAIDRVRPYLAGENIELPAIVVVGDQSSGKSSVLESISGIALPRGTNIVTRCPLELQLRRDKETYAVISRPAAVGLFGGDPNKVVSERIARLEDVTAAIEKYTDEIAGTNKGVSSSAISLRVHSPNAPDLTLIDLPGITRVPVGDQPEDIYVRVKALIHKYITGDDKIILCIIPASGADFSTAEGVLLARSVDPQQRRTLGVVTKIDKAEPGIRGRLLSEDAADLKLSMGFVAVRNRTQEEVAAREPLSRVRAREAQFFSQHAELSSLVGSGILGMQALEKRLVGIQAECLSAAMPRLKRKVADARVKAEKELAGMRGSCNSDSEAVLLFSERVNAVQRAFASAAEGDFRHVNSSYPDGTPQETLAKLHVATRVYDSFIAFQSQLSDAMPDFLSDAQYKHLEAMARQTRGMALANFMSSPVFNRCYAESVSGRLNGPAELLVRNVREYVETTLGSLVAAHFADFPRCHPLLKETVATLLDQSHDKSMGLVQSLVEQQRHIFTLNPWYGTTIAKYRGALSLVRELPGPAPVPQNKLESTFGNLPTFPDVFGLGGGQGEQAKPNQPPLWMQRVPKDLLEVADEAFLAKAAKAGGSEEHALREMQLSLKAYSKVVLRRVCDDVPLAVLEHMVMRVGDQLVTTIMRKAHGMPLLELMAEDPGAAARRTRLLRSVANLAQAQEELNKV